MQIPVDEELLCGYTIVYIYAIMIMIMFLFIWLLS